MTGFIQKLLDALSQGIANIVNLLPKSPFTFTVEAEFRQIMGYINYFIPIGGIIKITTAWLTCIIMWYIAQIALRWIKAIE